MARGGDGGIGGFTAARYGDVAKPTYPWRARVRGEQGKVLLSVRVSERGDVIEAKITESSGSAVLDDAAMSAVRQWRFSPARRGERNVESVVEVPIRFSLEDR